MKTLYVLRHAKSSWDIPSQSDFDRPLNKRGQRTAPRIGRLLVEENLVPELILCSTARRAHETADLVQAACDFSGQCMMIPELYLAGPTTYLEQIAEQNSGEQSIMVIGHNPGLEELVRQLTTISVMLPTAALAAIDLELDDWSGLSSGLRGILRHLWVPKELD